MKRKGRKTKIHENRNNNISENTNEVDEFAAEETKFNNEEETTSEIARRGRPNQSASGVATTATQAATQIENKVDVLNDRDGEKLVDVEAEDNVNATGNFDSGSENVMMNRFVETEADTKKHRYKELPDEHMNVVMAGDNFKTIRKRTVDVTVSRSWNGSKGNELEIELSWESQSEGSVTPQAQVEPCRRARETFLWRACQSAMVLCALALIVFIIISVWLANAGCIRSKKAPGCSEAEKNPIKHKQKCADFTRRSQYLRLRIGGAAQNEWQLQCQYISASTPLVLYDMRTKSQIPEGSKNVKCDASTNFKWVSTQDADITEDNIVCSCKIDKEKDFKGLDYEILRPNRVKATCKDSGKRPKMNNHVYMTPYVVLECRKQFDFMWQWQKVKCVTARVKRDAAGADSAAAAPLRQPPFTEDLRESAPMAEIPKLQQLQRQREKQSDVDFPSPQRDFHDTRNQDVDTSSIVNATDERDDFDGRNKNSSEVTSSEHRTIYLTAPDDGRLWGNVILWPFRMMKGLVNSTLFQSLLLTISFLILLFFRDFRR